jgi:glucose-1-phosphate thymidylyltransferase
VYFLRPDAFGVIEDLTPSDRGEFEITDVLNHYVRNGGIFAPHYTGHWADAGTIEALLEASIMAAQDGDQGTS